MSTRLATISVERRTALLTTVAVVVAVLGVASVAWFGVRAELHKQVDDSLRTQAQMVLGADAERGGGRGGGEDGRSRRPETRRGSPDFFLQELTASGAPKPGDDHDALPIPAAVRRVARTGQGRVFYDTTIGGDAVRVLAVPDPDGGVVQVGRLVEENASFLRRLRTVLLAALLLGVLLAIATGRLVARRAVRPVLALAGEAERVARTTPRGRLDVGTSPPELHPLARQLNAALDAVEESLGAQRRLVADASHELRTPIAGLRTNIDLLLMRPDLDAKDRTAALERAALQAEDLTSLTTELVELARGDVAADSPEPLRFDDVVASVLERAAVAHPGQQFLSELAPVVVVASRDRLLRAVRNLIDNGVKWAAPGTPVELSLDDAGTLVVRDHGPGFTPEDLEHVFDRFYRGAASRDRRGFGLGLAIVKQTAEAHGGSVHAGNAADGGAILRMSVPVHTSPRW